jgi:hypothetical protein
LYLPSRSILNQWSISYSLTVVGKNAATADPW